MNPLRERVLDDRKGFTHTGSKADMPTEQEIAMLRGEVLKLRKKLNQAAKLHEEQKDLKNLELVDKVTALERTVRELKRNNDKLTQAAAKSTKKVSKDK